MGALAQRRITNIENFDKLQQLSRGYAPGDSDMTWASLTLWRGIVASALDRHPHEPVESVEVSGPADSPAVDLAAGWLADRLAVSVRRTALERDGHTGFPIQRLVFFRPQTNITVEMADCSTVRVLAPNAPESLVALNVRSSAELLSEELRHLHADKTYAHALRALDRVSYT